MVDLIRRADQDKEPVTTHLYRTRKAEHSTDSGFVYMLTADEGERGLPAGVQGHGESTRMTAGTNPRHASVSARSR
jgi:hypothetical protein